MTASVWAEKAVRSAQRARCSGHAGRARCAFRAEGSVIVRSVGDAPSADGCVAASSPASLAKAPASSAEPALSRVPEGMIF